MNGAFYIGATGLNAQERGLGIIANNIANLNTPAFKRSEVSFSELVAPQPIAFDDGLTAIGGTALFAGVEAESSARAFSQGDLRVTGTDRDVAIDGEGFIELLGPEGEILLWRGGTLTVNDDGYLAATNRMPLRALISVPVGATDLTIDRNGIVRAMIDGESEPVEIGEIELALVRNNAGLESVGDATYRASSDSGVMIAVPGEDGAGSIVQGAIEGSNVDLANEVVLLLLMQRGFAANAQVVRAGDQLMAIANDLKR